MGRLWMVGAAVAGALAVALGAFGAHGLQERLPPARLATYQTAVLYHLVHALALGLCGLLARLAPGPRVNVAGGLMVAGLCLFSGSLYALALSGRSVLGAVAPVGGLALLAGWVALGWAAWTG